jgi:hypothetical protein
MWITSSTVIMFKTFSTDITLDPIYWNYCCLPITIPDPVPGSSWCIATAANTHSHRTRRLHNQTCDRLILDIQYLKSAGTSGMDDSQSWRMKHVLRTPTDNGYVNFPALPVILHAIVDSCYAVLCASMFNSVCLVNLIIG